MDYRAYAEHLQRKYGLKYFVPQIDQESHFDPAARSGAGAVGIAQIMPETAAGWHVDPNDPKASLEAAARHMAQYVKQYGNERDALIAYNAGPGRVGKSLPAETQKYLQIIMGNQGATQAPGNANASNIDATLRSIPGVSQDVPKQPSVYDVIARYRDATQPQPLAGGFGLAGIQDPYDPAASAKKTQDMVQRIVAMRTQPTASPVDMGSGAMPTGAETTAGGKVKITGPNPGRIKPEELDFLGKIAGVLGHEIVGSDGSGHSRLTVNGNVSEHTTGNAVDVPAKGKQLIEYGQAALIAAGMPEAEARKQTGGLFNVGNHQIIFNTMEGGDHFTHLHVGWRPGKR